MKKLFDALSVKIGAARVRYQPSAKQRPTEYRGLVRVMRSLDGHRNPLLEFSEEHMTRTHRAAGAATRLPHFYDRQWSWSLLRDNSNRIKGFNPRHVFPHFEGPWQAQWVLERSPKDELPVVFRVHVCHEETGESHTLEASIRKEAFATCFTTSETMVYRGEQKALTTEYSWPDLTL